MVFKDVLLALTSYPDPTPRAATEAAVAIAAKLGAHLAAVACEVHVEVPGRFLSGSIANIPGIIGGEAERSRANCRDMLAAFEAAAVKAGLQHETRREKCPTFAVPDILVEHARLRDLTIVPVPVSYDQWYAEAIIFGSGRPTLVLPEIPPARPFELGTVAVAWDFSRTAARAISDALPLLERARMVRIVTVMPRAARSAMSSRPTWRRSKWTCSRWAAMGMPAGESSSLGAPPKACCRGLRSRSCFLIEARSRPNEVAHHGRPSY